MLPLSGEKMCNKGNIWKNDKLFCCTIQASIRVWVCCSLDIFLYHALFWSHFWQRVRHKKGRFVGWQADLCHVKVISYQYYQHCFAETCFPSPQGCSAQIKTLTVTCHPSQRLSSLLEPPDKDLGIRYTTLFRWSKVTSLVAAHIIQSPST